MLFRSSSTVGSSTITGYEKVKKFHHKKRKKPRDCQSSFGAKHTCSAVPPKVAASPLTRPLILLNAEGDGRTYPSVRRLGTPAQKCCAFSSLRGGLSVGDPRSLSDARGAVFLVAFVMLGYPLICSFCSGNFSAIASALPVTVPLLSHCQ